MMLGRGMEWIAVPSYDVSTYDVIFRNRLCFKSEDCLSFVCCSLISYSCLVLLVSNLQILENMLEAQGHLWWDFVWASYDSSQSSILLVLCWQQGSYYYNDYPCITYLNRIANIYICFLKDWESGKDFKGIVVSLQRLFTLSVPFTSLLAPRPRQLSHFGEVEMGRNTCLSFSCLSLSGERPWERESKEGSVVLASVLSTSNAGFESGAVCSCVPAPTISSGWSLYCFSMPHNCWAASLFNS